MRPVFEKGPLMARRPPRASIAAVAAAASVWCMIVFSQNRLTDLRLHNSAPSSMAYVPQTEKIKPFLLGFHTAYADYLWIRTTLYFGSHFMTDRQYPWLVHMVDLVTRLNPQCYPAYEFAGLMLPDVCKNPGAARIILERGVGSNVERRWKLYYYLGMIYYRYYDDREMAAAYLACAVTQKNSPGFRLAGIAAAMFKKAGRPEEGRDFLELVYSLSENPEVKRYIRGKMERYSSNNK
jgi:hypothetical protein